jgi:hypothetical protein
MDSTVDLMEEPLAESAAQERLVELQPGCFGRGRQQCTFDQWCSGCGHSLLQGAIHSWVRVRIEM